MKRRNCCWQSINAGGGARQDVNKAKRGFGLQCRSGRKFPRYIYPLHQRSVIVFDWLYIIFREPKLSRLDIDRLLQSIVGSDGGALTYVGTQRL
jgi:hypothetical protein